MSMIHRLALISAAHNHVAIEGTEQSSLVLFYALKAQSEADAKMRVDQFDSSEIPGQYDLMTVLELVELIEHEAAHLVSFSESIMQAAHQGLMDAAEEPGFEMDASRWSLKAFAEAQLATEQGAGELEGGAAQDLITKLTALHPEKNWTLYPIGDYFQYAEADAPDVLVSFGCDEQGLEDGLVDPYSNMMGEACEPEVWGLSEVAAQLMKAYNKVNIAKYPNADGPKLA